MWSFKYQRSPVTNIFISLDLSIPNPQKKQKETAKSYKPEKTPAGIPQVPLGHCEGGTASWSSSGCRGGSGTKYRAQAEDETTGTGGAVGIVFFSRGVLSKWWILKKNQEILCNIILCGLLYRKWEESFFDLCTLFKMAWHPPKPCFCCRSFVLKSLRKLSLRNFPKNPWTLQWNGLNLYSSGVLVLSIATFEGSGFLGLKIFLSVFCSWEINYPREGRTCAIMSRKKIRSTQLCRMPKCCKLLASRPLPIE